MTAGLRKALTPRWWRRWPALSETEQQTAVGELVEAIPERYLRNLDPGPAVDVADRRDAQRQNELLAVKALSDRGAQLPPACRPFLNRLEQQDPKLAGWLVDLLIDPGMRPTARVGDLISSPPARLDAASPDAWIAIAEFAHAHQHQPGATEGFQRAVEAGAGPRAAWLARAALAALAAGDPVKAQVLLEDVTDTDHPLVPAARGVLGSDWEAVVAARVDADPADPNALMVELLAAHALARIDRGDEAIEQLEAIVERGEQVSGAAVEAARLRIQRASGPAGAGWLRDMRRARQLALIARDAMRKWRGPGDQAVALACEISAALGDWPRVLELAQAPPAGEAQDLEAGSQQVLRWAAAAATILGDLPLADDLIGRISSRPVQARLTAELAAVRGDADDQVRAAWTRAYDLAEDDTQRLAAQHGLASLGDWPLPGLDEIRERDEATADHLTALSEIARGDHAAAIQRLQKWARSRPPSARLLAEAHRLAGQPDRAVEVLGQLYERMRNPNDLIDAASILSDADRTSDADALITNVLTTLPPDDANRRLLRRGLITRAAQRQHWPGVVDQVHALRAEGLAEPTDRWQLIGALLNLQRLDDAWQELREHPPLEPDDAQHALAWVDLHRRYAPDTSGLTSRALDLLDRWPDDQRLNAVVLDVLVGGADPEVDEVTVGRARAAVIEILGRFPDRGVLLDVPDPQALVDQLQPMLLASRAAGTRAVRMVTEQGLPYGLLSSATGRTYAEVLLLRPTGYLPAHPADPHLAAQEQAAAQAAFDGPVAIDTSTLHLAALIQDRWPDLVGAFTKLEFPLPAAADLLAARDQLAQLAARDQRGHDATGSLTIDPATGTLQFHEGSAEQSQELASRAAWMAARAHELDRTPWDSLQRLAAFEREPGADRDRPWLAAVDLAATRQQPFYCDDIGLRRLAASYGVPTFGTVALLAALTAAGRLTTGDADTALGELTRHWVVDLPIDPARLRALADASDWAPIPAAYPLTRPAIWQQDRDFAYGFYREGCRRASQLGDDPLAGWLQAAALGLADGAPMPHRTQILGKMLVARLVDAGARPDRFAVLLRAARAIVPQIGASDPLPIAVRELHSAYSETVPPEAATRRVMRLCADLPDEDRGTAARALLLPSDP